jgi:hypothetical protein
MAFEYTDEDEKGSLAAATGCGTLDPPQMARSTQRSVPRRKRAARPRNGTARRLDLEARLATLPPDARDILPAMPVKVATAEATRLYAAAQRLRPKLVKLSMFRLDDLDDLPALVEALTAAELAWTRARAERQAGGAQSARREAETLRSSLLHSGRYLLRNDPGAQNELDKIAEGGGVADLVQDLRDLANLARAHPDEWKADVRLPPRAIERSLELAELLKASADPEPALAAEERRNQVFQLLERSVDEVRAAARYLLGDDPKRLQPFLSQWAAGSWRRHRRPPAS